MAVFHRGDKLDFLCGFDRSLGQPIRQGGNDVDVFDLATRRKNTTKDDGSFNAVFASQFGVFRFRLFCDAYPLAHFGSPEDLAQTWLRDRGSCLAEEVRSCQKHEPCNVKQFVRYAVTPHYRFARAVVCRCNQRRPISIPRRCPGLVCRLRDVRCPCLWCRQTANELRRRLSKH